MNCRSFIFGENFGANFLFQDLSDFRTRQLRPNVHLLGRFDTANPRFDKGYDLFGSQMSAGMKLHYGGNPLAPFCVWTV